MILTQTDLAAMPVPEQATSAGRTRACHGLVAPHHLKPRRLKVADAA